MSKQKKAGILSLGAGKCLSYALTLMLTLAAFLLPSSAMADVAWVEYNSSTKTLTFMYGEEKPDNHDDVTVYDLNEGHSISDWNQNTYSTVVFDKSFSSARPTTCYGWFVYQSSLTSITGLEYLNTEKVTNMEYMFSACPSLGNLDVSNFNTENVKSMGSMFGGCSSLESLDLSSFDTKNVTNMSCMFSDCSNLTTIFVSDKFSTANVTSSDYMFYGCSSLAGAATYTDENTGISMANYDGYFSKKEAWAEFNSSTQTLTFKCGKKPSDGSVTVYDLNEGTNIPEWNDNTYTTVVFDKSFSSARPTTCQSWFDSQSSLTSINGLEYLNTEKVTDMSFMFFYCSALENLDVSNFNTENVTNMGYMFYNCSSLKALDLSTFNTENVTGMSYMFEGCSNLTTIFTSDNFVVTNVKNSDFMFNECIALVGAAKYSEANTDISMANYDGYFSQKEAWVEFNSSTQTLTFKTGTDIPESEEPVTVYDFKEGDNALEWNSNTYTTVVFDKSFSSARPTTCCEWFNEQRSLTSIEGLKYLNTEKVKEMQSMFSGCEQLESLDLSNFNTANVTYMNWMFDRCRNLKSLDLSTFNTEKVTHMLEMFSSCTSLKNLVLSNFNTGNVTDMFSMFRNCSSLEYLDLSSFNTANVTDMACMFDGCSKLTTIFASDKFSTAKVTSSDGMFTDCTELVGAVKYDESKTDASMANYDGYFSQKKAWAEYDSSTQTLTFKTGTVKPESDETVTVYDLNEGDDSPGWLYKINATNVVFDQSFSDARPTSCREWFSEQYSLTSITGLEYLNTEKVTTMSLMFSCSSLESLDLSNFDTKNVTDMSDMFANCTALEVLDLSNFNTGNVTYMYGMFQNCTKLNTIYVSDKFSTAKVDDSYDMFLNCELLAGAKAYDERYTDASMANYDGYFSQKKAWAEYDSSTETLTFKTGTVKPESDETVTVYELNEGEDSPEWDDNTYTTVVFDKSFSSARPTTCYGWFRDQRSLTSIEGLEYLNTEKVTNMSFMFKSCRSLESLDLSRFNTEKVTSMKAMFSDCISLESLVLSNFNTANVTDMTCMFQGCQKLTVLDLSCFNTEKVTSMKAMFNVCTSLKGMDLSNFNTGNVTDMFGMFNNCSNLEYLDLSSFNTANVTDMGMMFCACSKLTTIYASDKFDATKVESSDDMFSDCTTLVGAVGYSASSIDHTMANYKTGYFKTYYKVGETKHDLCGETLSVENLTMEDDKDFVVIVPFTATSATYSRTMSSKWGTLCVPFEVEATETANTKYYKLESVGTDEITLTQLSGKIAAGTPMLVNSTDGDGNAANISISASSVEVGKAPADGTQADGWQLVGSFAETEVPDDGYIISKNKFWLVSDLKEKVSGAKSVKTKAMRAWLKPSAENAEAKAHVLSIALDEENETTAVDAIEALTEDTAEIYDLQGRRLNSLQKGLNIVKTGNVTRKIMVK